MRDSGPAHDRGKRVLRAWSCALSFGLASAWLVPSPVAAHGIAPRALGPLQRDAEGIHLVRLTRGLAMRSDGGFRYFCPSHWDGSESVPVTSSPGGAVVLALPSALFLVGPDGDSAPYPETGLGNVVALASADDGAYALAVNGERYELRRLLRDKSELLWSAAQRDGLFTALAAGEGTLLLLGLESGVLHQLTLRSDGSELSRAQADVGADALTVEAHVAGGTGYTIVTSESGDRIELGRIVDNRWLSLAQAVGNLSGPVAASDGKLFVALDGALASFDEEKVVPTRGTAFVTDVAVADGVLYASVREGLRVLAGGTLGDLVFAFQDLRGPRSDTLAPPERATCEGAWQHLQVDLVAAGLLGVDGARDAGAPSVLDAAATVDARVPVVEDASGDLGPTTHGDAGTALVDAAAQPAPPAARSADGCSAGAWPSREAAHASTRAREGVRPTRFGSAWCALAACLLVLRRRRPRAL